MVFHASGHKPHSQAKLEVSITNRLLVTMAGALLVFGGMFRAQNGAAYVLNWWREPIYAYGLIIAGIVVILVAWIPTRWTHQVVMWAARKTSGK